MPVKFISTGAALRGYSLTPFFCEPYKIRRLGIFFVGPYEICYTLHHFC
jgi:hypothetical protein